ncbi:MAG: hypothetical protein ACKVQQ_12540 [Burkholderiales bacterium]
MKLRLRPVLRPLSLALLLAASSPAQATNFVWEVGNYLFNNPLANDDQVTGVGDFDKNFHFISLVNNGNFFWNTGARLGFVQSTVTNNNVFDLRGDASLLYAGGAASQFVNNATFQKSVSGGVTTIGGNVHFVNHAIVRAVTGTIDFAGGLATFNHNSLFEGSGINRVSSNAAFNGTITSYNLQLSGGIFTGGNAVINGAVDWTGGNLAGTWEIASGQLNNHFATSHTINAKSGSDKNFNGVTFINNGIINWQTAERAGFVSGSVVTNNSLFDLQADANLTYAGGNASSFTNSAGGMFRKSGGIGTSTVGGNIFFVNQGGTIDAASGTIDFAGGLATFHNNTQFTGAGVNRVSNNATFNDTFTSANLLLTAGVFTGGDAVINGVVDWTGGNLAGTWTLGSGQTLNAKAGGDKNFNGVTFINNGTANWQTDERAGFVSGSVVTNNSLFDLQADANLTHAGGTASNFTNAASGTLRKSGGSLTSTVGGNIVFVNQGGIIDAASGTIDFVGGLATFNNGTQFTGAGINRVSSNATFNGAFTSANLQLTAGTFSGGGAAVSGTVDWTGGNLAGTWTLGSGQTLNANAGVDKNFNGVTFINHGTVNWQTDERAGFVSGSAVTNNSLFDLKTDADLTYAGGTASNFTNAASGTLRKSGGSLTSTVGGNIVFVNQGGIIDASSGTIDFVGGLATFNNGTQFTGAGINRVSNNATFNGAFTSANLQLTAGTFSGGNAVLNGAVDWTGGTLAGTWTIGSGQTLNANSASDKNFSGAALTNNGTINWQTDARAGFVSATAVTNNSLFDLKTDADLTYAGGSASSFVNNGTLRKSGGAGTSTIGVNVGFSNPGTIEALSGTLALPGNFNNAGLIKGNAQVQATLLINAGHVAPGTSPGTLTLLGNFQQTGAGTLDIEIASSSVFDTLIVTGTAQLGGTLALQCLGACAIATNDSMVILDSTGALTGVFAAVSTSGFGAGFTYNVQYDYGNDLVRLNVTNAGVPPIPEPEGWAMLLAGFGLTAFAAQRRRRSTTPPAPPLP